MRWPEEMSRADVMIVTTLVESGLALTPHVLAFNLSLSRSWVNKRLSLLESAKLVERAEHGLYRSTDRAEAIVDGSATDAVVADVNSAIEAARNAG